MEPVKHWDSDILKRNPFKIHARSLIQLAKIEADILRIIKKPRKVLKSKQGQAKPQRIQHSISAILRKSNALGVQSPSGLGSCFKDKS